MTATASMTPEQGASLKSIWEEQNEWSQAADRLKQQVQTARLRAGVLSLLGAFLATLASVLAQENGGALQGSHRRSRCCMSCYSSADP